MKALGSSVVWKTELQVKSMECASFPQNEVALDPDLCI